MEAENTQAIAAERLKSFFERIERLTEDRKAITTDISEVMAEAKSEGFDGPAIRAVIKLRSMDPADRQTMEAMVDHYRDVLGMPAESGQ